MSKVRVRFAPSPTGPLHIGGLRTALYNYLFARNMGGTFILRIEDTDQKRYVEEAENYILEALNWCGINPDEGPQAGGSFGPYRQSERKSMYTRYAMQLLDSGHAYWAFDSQEELAAWRDEAEKAGGPPPKYDATTRSSMKNSLSLDAAETAKLLSSEGEKVLRLRVPLNEDITFTDLIRGAVTFSSSEIDDKIILKGDGMPTYHLANIVDDHLMQISHVIRGEEWLSSCPLHVLMYRFFGWEQPAFAHLPLILNPNGKGKLSKRTADKLGFPVFPLNWLDPASGDIWPGFREAGFEVAAFLNMLAFLGWNPGVEQEIYTIAELEKVFSLERVGKSGARFDFEKATWFNEQHVRFISDEVLAERLGQSGISMNADQLRDIAGMMKERISFFREIEEQGAYFFGPVTSYDEKMVRKKYKPELRPQFEKLADQLETLEEFSESNVENEVKSFMEANSLGFGAVLPVLRLAIAGTTQGPPAFKIMEVLGKEKVVLRIRESLADFDALLASAAS